MSNDRNDRWQRMERRLEWSSYAEAAVSNLSDTADPHLAAQRAIVIADTLLAAGDVRFPAEPPIRPVLPSTEGDR